MIYMISDTRNSIFKNKRINSCNPKYIYQSTYEKLKSISYEKDPMYELERLYHGKTNKTVSTEHIHMSRSSYRKLSYRLR